MNSGRRNQRRLLTYSDERDLSKVPKLSLMQFSVHGPSPLANFQLKEQRVKRFLINKPKDYVIRTINEVYAAAHRPHFAPFENSQVTHTPSSPSRLFKHSLQHSRNQVILSSHKQWLYKHGKTFSKSVQKVDWGCVVIPELPKKKIRI